jgi:hypothetical protein
MPDALRSWWDLTGGAAGEHRRLTSCVAPAHEEVAMTRCRALLSVALLVPFLGGAAPRELAGVRMPTQVQVAGKTLVLNGMGIREATILNVDVYVAGLYLETRSSDAKRVLASAQIKRLELHFVREVTREQVIEAWNEGFGNNAGAQLPKLRARIRALDELMKDFRAGGTLTFTCVPGTGVQVEIGRELRGTIAGDDFARALLSIWLGPRPPNAGLKTGLLGRS